MAAQVSAGALDAQVDAQGRLHVVRMLQRDGHPTALGEAIASYGRIPKTLHLW